MNTKSKYETVQVILKQHHKFTKNSQICWRFQNSSSSFRNISVCKTGS